MHAVIYSLGVDMGPLTCRHVPAADASERGRVLIAERVDDPREGPEWREVAYQKGEPVRKAVPGKVSDISEGQVPDGRANPDDQDAKNIREIDSDDIRVHVKQISTLAGLKFRPHDMRRTFGHRLWEQGLELETIEQIMRHE